MTHHPRSAKQQAHARTIASRTYSASTAILPMKASGVPRESWWLTCRDREGFTAKAREEHQRIANSRFAQVSDPTYRE